MARDSGLNGENQTLEPCRTPSSSSGGIKSRSINGLLFLASFMMFPMPGSRRKMEAPSTRSRAAEETSGESEKCNIIQDDVRWVFWISEHLQWKVQLKLGHSVVDISRHHLYSPALLRDLRKVLSAANESPKSPCSNSTKISIVWKGCWVCQAGGWYACGAGLGDLS